jgi:DNA-binding transcriptional MerR regulator
MKERGSMLKIGEFAHVGQVSIATLRHYEKHGLLKPAALDIETGNRYYSLDQLPRLNRILALKDLGFPLEQIARLLEKNLSLEQLRGMFERKQAYIQEVIEAEQARLLRVAARLRQIEQEESMPTYVIRLKHVDPMLVASVRESIPIVSERGHLFETLSAYLEREGVQHSQPDLLLLHSRHQARDEDMSIVVEVAVPIPDSLPGNEQVAIRTLPAGLMASTVHTGDDLSLGRAYMALYRWVEDNGYRLTGPVRQVHLLREQHRDPSHYVTEVQFSVEEL